MIAYTVTVCNFPVAAAVYDEWTKEVHVLEKHGKDLLASYGEKCPKVKYR